MPLRIGDRAPDFEAETTKGRIRFHEWLGKSWGLLFSHPKDFTPVCTTELGYLAKLEPEFAERDCKVIGLSVDPVGDHTRWLSDIQEVTGGKVDYPLIGDSELRSRSSTTCCPRTRARARKGARRPRIRPCAPCI